VYLLWQAYAVHPGTYDLFVFPEGMTEALPVGENIAIKKRGAPNVRCRDLREEKVE